MLLYSVYVFIVFGLLIGPKKAIWRRHLGFCKIVEHFILFSDISPSSQLPPPQFPSFFFSPPCVWHASYKVCRSIGLEGLCLLIHMGRGALERHTQTNPRGLSLGRSLVGFNLWPINLFRDVTRAWASNSGTVEPDTAVRRTIIRWLGTGLKDFFFSAPIMSQHTHQASVKALSPARTEK